MRPLALPAPQRVPSRCCRKLRSHELWGWFEPDRFSTAMRELPELSGAIADLPGLLQADGSEALPISLLWCTAMAAIRQAQLAHAGRQGARLEVASHCCQGG